MQAEILDATGDTKLMTADDQHDPGQEPINCGMIGAEPNQAPGLLELGGRPHRRSGTRSPENEVAVARDVVQDIHDDEISRLWRRPNLVDEIPDARHGTRGARWPDGSIHINRNGSHIAVTALHEHGHTIDAFLGGGGYLSSNDDGPGVLAEVLSALRRSEGVRSLQAQLNAVEASGTPLRAAAALRYLLSNEEMFARGYAQWSAQHGPRWLRRQLEAVIDSEPGRQWSDRDFEEIAETFDALFER